MKDINVLIIDDEQYILNALQRMFRKEPFGIFCTTDHKEALNVLEDSSVKVVISDHKMPDILGLDFLKIVKSKWPRIIRIIFTGYSNLQVIQEAFAKGEIYKVIDKPWDDGQFKAEVCEAIKKYEKKSS